MSAQPTDLPRRTRVLTATEKMPAWGSETVAQRLDHCRAMLNIHGFLSEAENDRVSARIERWAANHGVKRQKRSK